MMMKITSAFSTKLTSQRLCGKSIRTFASTRSTKASRTPSPEQNRRNFKKSHRLCSDSGDTMNSLAEGTDVWLPKTCGFIGGGQMADALLAGFLEKRAFKKENVVVSDVA